jgi:CHAT domain-containing protein
MSDESHIHKYNDFDVEILKSGSSYVARVLKSPSGEARCGFDKRPVAAAELKRFAQEILIRGAPARRVDRPDAAAAKRLGEKLYAALFAGDVLTCYERSLQQCLDTEGLRVRLRFQLCPELMNIPWELLYDRRNDNFLGMAPRTPIVRYMELGQPISPLIVSGRLKVLVVTAAPRVQGLGSLKIKSEFRDLKKALKELEDVGRVEIEELNGASIQELHDRLNAKVFHVIHFIGHGTFDEDRGEGSLLFEGPGRSRQDVSGAQLGIVLQSHRTRLVVINSCDGARTDAADPFSGVAQSLVQKGIPAVVGMQFSITDDAALAFSRVFYRSIAEGVPVDRAVTNARQSIMLAPNWLEWATPVLYLRAEHGDLFDFRNAGGIAGLQTAATTASAAPRPSRQSGFGPDGDPQPDLPAPAFSSAGP